MKLTKATLNDLLPAATRYTVWDEEIPAFGVRVAPSGRQTFILFVRIRGRKTTLTIGKHGDITASQARARAHAWRDQVGQGLDPRQAKREARDAMTFDKLAERFLEEHVEVYLSARTQDTYRQQVSQVIAPFFKRMAVRDITPEDVARFHVHARGDGMNRRANHCLAVLSKMLSLAEEWGARPLGTNPCQHRKRFPETRRQRYLDEGELVRLGKALKAAETSWSPFALAAIRVLLLTGGRKSEILHARWDQVDLKAGVLRVDDHKTAAGHGAKSIPLGAPVVDLLRKLPRQEDSPWVFPGSRRDGPVGRLDDAWQAVRAAAGLDDVHLHDLRHTFGATAAGHGHSLRVIGAVLGHTAQATTQRYAHVAESPAKAAADETSRALAKAMRKRK